MNTETRMLSANDRFRVHYGIYHGCFSILGRVETFKQGTWVCCHLGLLRGAIQDLFPHLAYLLKWHRTKPDGTPSGYQSQGLFWYHGYRQDDPPYRIEYATQRFRETIVCGAVKGDDETVLDFYLRGAAPSIVSRWLDGRLPDVQEVFHKDMANASVDLPTRAYTDFEALPF